MEVFIEREMIFVQLLGQLSLSYSHRVLTPSLSPSFSLSLSIVFVPKEKEKRLSQNGCTNIISQNKTSESL